MGPPLPQPPSTWAALFDGNDGAVLQYATFLNLGLSWPHQGVPQFLTLEAGELGLQSWNDGWPIKQTWL